MPDESTRNIAPGLRPRQPNDSMFDDPTIAAAGAKSGQPPFRIRASTRALRLRWVCH